MKILCHENCIIYANKIMHQTVPDCLNFKINALTFVYRCHYLCRMRNVASEALGDVD